MKKASKTVRLHRQNGVAGAFIDKQLALGRVAFSLHELMGVTGLTAIAARHQLRRLPGRVVRVSPRQQFFLIISPEHRGMGAPPATWWLHDYFNWLGRPYYLALQSAAAALGSNPQALQVTQVMTDRPFRAIAVGRIRVRFFVKHAIEHTPLQHLSQAPAPLYLSTPEATVFDLVRYASRIGGIDRVVETIFPLVPDLRIREFKRLLQAEKSPAIAQRLGFILEAYGAQKLADVVHSCLPERLNTVPLSSTRSEDGNFPVIARWRVINNSKEPKS